ncbi:9845_t:CDS:2, partial [Gigaspora margarita]
MSASGNKTSYSEAYTSLLKVYQEANLTKKRDIAIQKAQSLWNQERNKLKHMEKQVQASSTTIAKDTIENITEDITDDTTDDMSKRRKTLAQTKLKEELIRLNRELSQLQDLEDKGMVKVLYVKKDNDSDLTFKQTYRIIDCGTTGQNLIYIVAKLSTRSEIRVTKCCGSNTSELLDAALVERKKVVQNKILVSSKALSKLETAGINTQLIKPVGRSHLEEAQPGLLETILRLVSSDRQANERRRSEIIWSIKTLDQLHAALKQMNYKISHLASYLRLLPKWFNTEEEKRHVKTVPVKLLRSQNTARKRHENTHFCASLVRNIKEMVSLLGPQSILTIFQDDKARIPLGLAAANKQAPILMRVEYRVELSDHDWVVAEKYKLSIHLCDIRNTKCGKHDTSTVYTYSKDFDDLMSDERLHNFTTTKDSQSKPVVLILADGGPDENPCYKKTIQVMIEHFIKYNLDTIIAVCFALHQSASNPVERRMVPLSHDLAGIILPHNTFGSYLDEQLKTTNDKLEKHNFKAAGEILVSVWENTVIDGYPVLVEYVDPEELYQSRLDEKSVAWIERHTMTCRYITQVVKCNDTSCCRPFRSRILQLLSNWFFSPPILVQQKSHSICAASINVSDDTMHFILPLTNLLISTSAHSVINTSDFQDTDHLVYPIVVVHNYQYGEFLVSNDKGEAMWIEEDTIPEDVPESLFQEVKHIRTNQDCQAYLINWETWKPEWTND